MLHDSLRSSLPRFLLLDERFRTDVTISREIWLPACKQDSFLDAGRATEHQLLNSAYHFNNTVIAIRFLFCAIRQNQNEARQCSRSFSIELKVKYHRSGAITSHFWKFHLTKAAAGPISALCLPLYPTIFLSALALELEIIDVE